MEFYLTLPIDYVFKMLFRMKAFILAKENHFKSNILENSLPILPQFHARCVTFGVAYKKRVSYIGKNNGIHHSAHLQCFLQFNACEKRLMTTAITQVANKMKVYTKRSIYDWCG